MPKQENDRRLKIWPGRFIEGEHVILDGACPSSYGLRGGEVLGEIPGINVPAGYVPVRAFGSSKIQLQPADDLEHDLQPQRKQKPKCGRWTDGNAELFRGDRVIRLSNPKTIWRVMFADPDFVPNGHAPLEPEDRDLDAKPVAPFTDKICNLARVQQL